MKLSRSLYSIPALLAVFGCNQPETTAPSANAAAPSANEQANSDEIANELVSLKAMHLPDEAKRYADILTKHGISLETPITEYVPVADAAKSPKAPLAKAAVVTEEWTELFSTPAVPVQRVVYKKYYLSAGTTFLFTTTGGAAGIDPAMVVFRVNSDAWRSSGDMPVGAVTSLISVDGFSDDVNGAMPRLVFTAPVTGWYGLLVFAYSPYNHGDVSLKSGVACASQPSGGYCITGTESSETINVRGSTVWFSRYYSGNFDAGKFTSTDGADPMLWMFDYHGNYNPPTFDGLVNDDDPRGGTVNSYAFSTAMPTPAFGASDLRFGVMSGYADGGTASFHGGSIWLKGICISAPGRTCP